MVHFYIYQIKIVRTNNNQYWKNPASLYPATMLTNAWNFYTDIRKSQLPCLVKKTLWVNTILLHTPQVKWWSRPYLGVYHLWYNCSWTRWMDLWFRPRPNNHIIHIQVTQSTTDETEYILSIKEQLCTTMVNFNQNFIFGVVTNRTFNTSYSYEVFINPFYFTGVLVRIIV